MHQSTDGSWKFHQEVAPSLNGFHKEPRCRVCRNDTVLQKVNSQLAQGSSYAMIVRALDHDNDALDVRDRVTIDSVRNHSTRHFPVQNAARATYREIIERRANENGVDFVNGIATALTPIGYLEIVMLRGFETLVETNTKVDVQTAMAAAGKLHAILESREGQGDVAAAYVKLNRIIEAIKSTVPEELWPEILRKLEGETESFVSFAADSDTDAFDPGDEVFDDDDED
jgi:hypothetical protein